MTVIAEYCAQIAPGSTLPTAGLKSPAAGWQRDPSQGEVTEPYAINEEAVHFLWSKSRYGNAIEHAAIMVSYL